MANKFLTTQRKKIIATGGLLVSGWHVLTMGGNPLNLPGLPNIIDTSHIGNITLLFVAGIITLATIIMIWTDY